MCRDFFLATSLVVAFHSSSFADTALIASYDADFYYAYGRSVQTARPEIYVGNELNPNVGLDYNFASLKWSSSNLSLAFSSLPSSEKIFLRLNLLPFEVYTGPPNFGPPPYELISNGVDFQFRVVKLQSDFSTLTKDNKSTYYAQNFSTDQTVGVNYSVSGVGEQLFDVTTLVQDWISSPATNFGLGLVGVADASPYINSSNSASYGVTMIFSASENGNGSLSPALIPEPKIKALLLGALLLSLVANRRKNRRQNPVA
jgi:hypothetical protein